MLWSAFLVWQVEGALASGQPLILVHEGRAGRGAARHATRTRPVPYLLRIADGCRWQAPFAEIIARTPQRLRQLGLPRDPNHACAVPMQ